MNTEDRNTIIVVLIAIIVIVGGYVCIKSASGVSPPFTVVESHSMQHCQLDDRHSDIGIIDTGDLILVRSPSKCTITSYIEGSQNGYQKFGDYGDVIVYKRVGQNPVIHRAFLWLDWNGSSWSAPALENYAGDWNNTGSGNDYMHMSGTLSFTGVGVVVEGGKNLSIDLDSLPKTSGYLTLGDSVNNQYFDQNTIIISSLISEDMIKSVAWKEIPWLGALKLMIKGNTSELNSWAPNSKTMLICEFAMIIVMLYAAIHLAGTVMSLRRRE